MTDQLKPLDEMTDSEFLEWVVADRMAGWIPLRMFLRMYPTESVKSVEQRLRRGIWQRGVHYHVPDRSGAWVNLNAIRAWIEKDIEAAKKKAAEEAAVKHLTSVALLGQQAQERLD